MISMIDIVGTKFNRLTVLEYIGGYKQLCRVRCDCGVEKEVRYSSLKSKKFATKSCGCLHMEQCKSGKSHLVHGDARKGQVKRLHNIWRRMLSKCYHEKCDRFPYYGARGIKICDEWQQYVPFRDWAMNHGYNEKLTIHRKDNDGNYEPSNCMWADKKTQMRNMRTTRYVVVNGKTICLAECAEIYGMKYKKLQGRLDRGWDIERAISY